jgi:hypothetical protein
MKTRILPAMGVESHMGVAGMWRRLYLHARLVAAAIAWINLKLLVAWITAAAGLPASSPEIDRSWEDFRKWAASSSTLSKEQKLNLRYSLRSALLPPSGIVARVLTDSRRALVGYGAIAWPFSLGLIRSYVQKRLEAGGEVEFGRWGMQVFWSFFFWGTCGFSILITGEVLKAIH